ncbi:MAG: hypothetical protein FJZ49_06670 [Candidatus Verstraetearchaeota archaeon]|nr:hypothetical protein [Candidatus Verstraetearchaeota archaeon]
MMQLERDPRMNLNMKTSALALLLLLVFLGGSSVQYVTAFSCHYEFDKDYYHPGDVGYFLAEVNNNQPDYVTIAQATLNITGIGVFTWDSSTINASNLHSASLTNVPLFAPNGTYLGDVVGCRIERGGSATFHVYFKIPEDAKKGDYPYTFNMPIMIDLPVEISGSIAVYPQGEVPPPDVVGEALSLLGTAGLLLLLVLSPVYLVLRWKKKARAAKYAKIVLILSVILVFAALWKIIAFAMYLGFVFFPFWPLLALIIIVVLLWRRRKRKKLANNMLEDSKKNKKDTKAFKLDCTIPYSYSTYLQES